MVKDWHYPLPPLSMNNPSVLTRTSVQNQPQIDKDSGEIIQQKSVEKSNMGPNNGGSGNSDQASSSHEG